MFPVAWGGFRYFSPHKKYPSTWFTLFKGKFKWQNQISCLLQWTTEIRICPQFYNCNKFCNFFWARLGTRGHFLRHIWWFWLFCVFLTRAGVEPGMLGWKSSIYHCTTLTDCGQLIATNPNRNALIDLSFAHKTKRYFFLSWPWLKAWKNVRSSKK